MNIGRRHLYMPDTQVKPDVYIDHLEALGNYAVDKKPDVIVCAGDHFDMHSLSVYDRKTARAEGARYQDDIDAGIEGMQAFLEPIRKYNKGKSKHKRYEPRKVFTAGNHEDRILRHVNANPELLGKLSYDDFRLKDDGWEVYDFLVPVTIDGITYAHYFYVPNTGRPFGGTAHNKLKNIGFTFVMGHVQGLDVAIRHLNNGQTIRGVVAGSFYQHNEAYKGPQANDHWRGALMLNEVKDGNYCMMELSIDYLLRRWV